MSNHWILDKDHNVVPADLMEWAKWFEDYENRRVRLTRVGLYYVSTVFLGISHNFGNLNEPKQIFESMVYIKNKHTIEIPDLPEAGIKGYSREVNNEFLDIQYRCDTWREAVAQHESVMAEVMQPGDEIEEVSELSESAQKV